MLRVSAGTIVEAATPLLAQTKGEKLDAILRNLEAAVARSIWASRNCF
jgi:hypothetical protein